MSPSQKEIFESVKTFVLRRDLGEKLDLSDQLPAKDRAFVKQLAKELGVRAATEKKEGGYAKLQVEWTSDEDTETEDESDEARARILRKYEKAEIVNEEEEMALGDALEKQRLEDEFRDWKAGYYKVRWERTVDSRMMI
jgi:5'-3' exoribonuclease 1